jgi:hypothetical protein
MMKKIYVIGSLRNREGVSAVSKQLRDRLPGFIIFDDWLAPGPTADDEWRDYEKARGRSYEDALRGYAARHVFQFDKGHLDSSDAVLLVMPAGKSAFLELGYMVGQGKPTAILLDDQERWDVMFQFAGCVSSNLELVLTYVKSALK